MPEVRDSLDRFDRLTEGHMRRSQFSEAEGRVLDVACGTGTNFRYVPESTEIVGVDLVGGLLGHAATRAGEVGRTADFAQADAEALPFTDDAFDTVVSGYATCSFPNPVAALNEMERVCRPGGEVRLLDHGKSWFGPYARYQEWHKSYFSGEGGCRLLDDPVDVVEQSRLRVVEVERWRLGAQTGITAWPSETS